MQDNVERTPSRHRTLGWLAETAFAHGNEYACKALEAVMPDAIARPHSVRKHSDGEPATRRDIEQDKDGIDYIQFNPPATWEPRYSVSFVRFAHVLKHDYMSHGGEELIVPVTGAITYHFYCPGPKPLRLPRREVLKTPLKPESITRINPQMPHHTWAADHTGASAWMIFHHVSETTTANLLDADPERDKTRPTPPHRVTEELLQDPARYALVAWGLSEKLRLARARANISIAQMAKACSVDSSLISRLENAESNISLDALLRIARFLRIDVATMIAAKAWNYETEPLPRVRGKEPRLTPVLKDRRPHVLHALLWELPAQAQAEITAFANRSPVGAMSTWIVLQGRVVFDLPEGAAPEIIATGGVLHLRDTLPAKLHALETGRVLQVYCSDECRCADDDATPR